MKTLEQSVREFCDELKVPEPIEFLTQVMAGHDPRQLSSIYEFVKRLEEEYGDDVPDKWDYIELIYKIKERYMYTPVSINESHAAANQLMQYTHAKKKQVEHSGHILDSGEVKPLTEEEVDLFMEKFDANF